MEYWQHGNMKIFDWLTGKSRFIRCDDMYAPTRKGLWAALKKTVLSPQHSQKAIWLVAHFTNTFMALQDELESWNVDYEVVTQPLDITSLSESSLIQPGRTYLVMASLLECDGLASLQQPDHSHSQKPDPASVPIAIIMVERHPHLKYDQRVESFGRRIPACSVEFGYFNSLDDVVLGLVINETLMTILRQLGLNDHELITSTLVSRRLEKMLNRVAPTYLTDHPADSASDWIQLNGPPQTCVDNQAQES